MLPKSLVRVAGVIFACLGVAVCLALIVVIWAAGNRVERATERLFSSAERGLVVTEERFVRTQQQIAVAREAAEDIEKSLVSWTILDGGQRAVLKQTVAEKTEKLAHILEQSDLWLEIVELSVGRVSELLAMVTSAGSSTGTASVAQLVNELAALRAKVAEATAAVARIQQRVTDPSEAAFGRGDFIDRRLLAPLDSINSRFDSVERRLSATRGQLQELNAGVRQWIHIVMIGSTLLLFWMAAGQVALGWLAWTAYHHRQP